MRFFTMRFFTMRFFTMRLFTMRLFTMRHDPSYPTTLYPPNPPNLRPTGLISKNPLKLIEFQGILREPRVGLEPTTFSLRMKCSTN